MARERRKRRERVDEQDAGDLVPLRLVPERRTRKRKPAAPKPREVQVPEEKVPVLTDYLMENLGVTLAQARRAVRALQPGSRVFERGNPAPVPYMRAVRHYLTRS